MAVLAGGRILLEGDLPSPTERIDGCRFRTRCPLYHLLDEGRQEQCRTIDPGLEPVHGRGVADLLDGTRWYQLLIERLPS